VNKTAKQHCATVTQLSIVPRCFALCRRDHITSRFTSYALRVLSLVIFIGMLHSTIVISYADTSCGVVTGGSFEKTVDVVEQVEPKLRCVQTDGVTLPAQRKPKVGLACLTEIEDPDSIAMGPKHMETSEPGNPRALVVERRSGIHWDSLISQWWFDIAFEQTERLIMEPKTRDQLYGKFFHEWFSDVAQYRYGLWNDGDKFFTSYIGHSLQGAVIEGIFSQNDDRVRFSEQDFHSAAYRKALLQAFAFAAVDAVQWKLGPVSEATIGHVGLPAHWWSTPYFCNLAHAYCHPRTGLNDLVMNEVGGTAMTIGFQWVDKHFQRPMENRINSRALIDTMRIFTNPPQSLANFFRFRTPWYRDNRD